MGEDRCLALLYGKIKLLGDVTPERVETLARNRWECSQMGIVKVGTADDLVMAVRHLELKGMDALAPIWMDHGPERGRGHSHGEPDHGGEAAPSGS